MLELEVTVYILNDVKITGLWHTTDLSLRIHGDVNFLIGVNGSGKTTVIRLIIAALTADLAIFDKTAFKTLNLYLRPADSSQGVAAQIVVEKGSSHDGACHIFYTIETQDAELSLKKTQVYSPNYSFIRPSLTERIPAARSALIRERIGRLVRTTWLPIHRNLYGVRSGKSFESSVDDRLDELGMKLIGYFSELASTAEKEAKAFQQSVFQAITPTLDMQGLARIVGELDVKREEKDLRDILEDFDAAPSDETLKNYFKQLRGAFKVMASITDVKEDPAVSLTFAQSGALIAIEIIHKIVRSWNLLKGKRRVIFEPRDTFLRILNESGWRKSYFIDTKNELQARMDASEELVAISRLSSGEKQLIIILGEALLQRKLATIYIADEPEPSLHVRWQEKLVDMLRELNPSAQIIFATHSPDIVSHYGNRVIDMETLVA